MALGRAIVREPSVFLLDEPLSNLDAKLRVQTRAELSKLHQRLGTTFVYVTHDQVEAMTMASRIAVLNQGVLQQVGEPQELYERPKNVFVAGFIGSPSMNFIELSVGKDGDTTILEAEGLRLAVPDDKAAPLTPFQDKKIIFGIRPEDIHAQQYQSSDVVAAPVQAKVDVTELMGNEFFLHMVSGEWEFMARVDARTPARPGQEISLVFNMAKMHAFDAGSEASILL